MQTRFDISLRKKEWCEVRLFSSTIIWDILHLIRRTPLQDKNITLYASAKCFQRYDQIPGVIDPADKAFIALHKNKEAANYGRWYINRFIVEMVRKLRSAYDS